MDHYASARHPLIPTQLGSSSLPARHLLTESPSSNDDRQRKRRRTSGNATPNNAETDTEEEPIESIDLTEAEGPSSLAKILAKQREDAVKAQQGPEQEKGRSLLTAYKCPVCMDTPVDATTTVCGHLFCHKCIIDTLKFSEDQRVDSAGKRPRGTCPVCRKPLLRVDAPGAKRNLVPLQLQLTKRGRNAVPADSA